MAPLSYRKMDFEEFCAAAISTYQLEAREEWQHIASTAFEHFEQEGNRAISVEELVRVCKNQDMRFFPLYSNIFIVLYHFSFFFILSYSYAGAECSSYSSVCS